MYCEASTIHEMKENDASLFNTIVSDEQEKGDDTVTTLQMNKVNFKTMGIPQTTSQQFENTKMNATSILSKAFDNVDAEKYEDNLELSNSMKEDYFDFTENPPKDPNIGEDEYDIFLEDNTESSLINIDENTTGFLEFDEFVGNSTRQSRLLAAGEPEKSSGEIMFQNIYRSQCVKLKSSAILIFTLFMRYTLM